MVDIVSKISGPRYVDKHMLNNYDQVNMPKIYRIVHQSSLDLFF